ncbi:hypothetical protein ACOMHN_005436 [Nucella lapillus]
MAGTVLVEELLINLTEAELWCKSEALRFRHERHCRLDSSPTEDYGGLALAGALIRQNLCHHLQDFPAPDQGF